MKNPYHVGNPEYHITGTHRLATIRQTYRVVPKIIEIVVTPGCGILASLTAWDKGRLQAVGIKTIEQVIRHKASLVDDNIWTDVLLDLKVDTPKQ